MPIEVIDVLKQKNNGSFPLIEAKDVKGGFNQVNSVEERNNIPKEKRIEGMYCYVLNDKIYKLIGGIENSNWVTVKSTDFPNEELFTLYNGVIPAPNDKGMQYLPLSSLVKAMNKFGDIEVIVNYTDSGTTKSVTYEKDDFNITREGEWSQTDEILKEPIYIIILPDGVIWFDMYNTNWDTVVVNSVVLKQYQPYKLITPKDVDNISYSQISDAPTPITDITSYSSMTLSGVNYNRLRFGNNNLIDVSKLTKEDFANTPFTGYSPKVGTCSSASAGNGYSLQNKYTEGGKTSSGLKLTLEQNVTHYLYFATDVVRQVGTTVTVTDSTGKIIAEKTIDKYMMDNAPLLTFRPTTEYTYILFGTTGYNVQIYNGTLSLVLRETQIFKDFAKLMYMDNTKEFTPTEDYHPATKKYVDDNLGGSGDATSVNGISIWTGTQTEYDVISSKSDKTLYIIKE